MGVSEPTKYTIIDHAQERILERFNVTPGEQQKWAQRLFQSASQVEVDKAKHREHWKSNNISFIIDTNKRNLITVWSDDVGKSMKVEKKDLNPTVVSAVKDALGSATRKALRHWADRCAPKYQEIAELTNQISKTNSSELLETKESRVKDLLSEISVLKSGYEDIVSSANAIL